MSVICSAGTYLPPWTAGGSGRRVSGPDEDALTMAVAAGRAADTAAEAERVVLVSRDMPLLEGGNGAVLLAGLSLSPAVAVREVLGGAPAVLDEVQDGAPGTLVIAAADDSACGSAAVAVLLGGESGPQLVAAARQTRSLPVVVRQADGRRRQYGDPRLQRELGFSDTLARMGLDHSRPVAAAAGIGPKQLAAFTDVGPVTTNDSAAGVLGALVDAIEQHAEGLVIAAEQSSITVAELTSGVARIQRVERRAQVLPSAVVAEGPEIPISLAAYARAFDPKLRWDATVFGEPSEQGSRTWFPPRSVVTEDGRLRRDGSSEPLPRTGCVYTQTTVHLPVPGIASPYSLAVVQLDDSPVRVLLKVTGVPAGETRIGSPGTVVLRRIATRTGIPDYGPAFLPSELLGSTQARN